jgi:hypothetical protein
MLNHIIAPLGGVLVALLPRFRSQLSPQAPLPIKIGAANATDHAAAFIGVERGHLRQARPATRRS